MAGPITSLVMTSDTISISQSYAIRLAINLQRIQQRGRMDAEEKNQLQNLLMDAQNGTIGEADLFFF
uniref:Uncharacterized protein n=1 Tax=Oryza meridionalis TaxID=40149 RepID=A0A0E0EEP6_9ORYZ